MQVNFEREIFDRCVANARLRPDDFSMEDRLEAHIVRGGTVQSHRITVTCAPTDCVRVYRSALPAAWSAQFRKDLADGLFDRSVNRSASVPDADVSCHGRRSSVP